jgi:hypothetical protein
MWGTALGTGTLVALRAGLLMMGINISEDFVMTGRERLEISLDHREPDRVPLDLGRKETSAISVVALEKWLRFNGIRHQPVDIFSLATQPRVVNRLWGVAIPFAISDFGIFMMRQYCLGVPDDLIAAARIDGAGEFSIEYYVDFGLVMAATTLVVLPVILLWARPFPG